MKIKQNFSKVLKTCSQIWNNPFTKKTALQLLGYQIPIN